MINNLKIFTMWFLFGSGLLLSGALCFHSVRVFFDNNLWWFEHWLEMLAIFVIPGGLFVGIAAIALRPKIMDSSSPELHEFISQSLIQTLSGIRTANNDETKGESIDKAPKPFLLEHGASKEKGTGIEFDIAVTTKSQAGAGGSGKVGIYLANAEIRKEGSSAREQVARIKFTVFINQWRG